MIGKDWMKTIAEVPTPWWSLLEFLITRVPIPKLGATARYIDLDTRMQSLPADIDLQFPQESTAASYWKSWKTICSVTEKTGGTRPPQ